MHGAPSDEAIHALTESPRGRDGLVVPARICNQIHGRYPGSAGARIWSGGGISRIEGSAPLRLRVDPVAASGLTRRIGCHSEERGAVGCSCRGRSRGLALVNGSPALSDAITRVGVVLGTLPSAASALGLSGIPATGRVDRQFANRTGQPCRSRKLSAAEPDFADRRLCGTESSPDQSAPMSGSAGITARHVGQ